MNLLSLLLGIAAVVFAVHSVQVRGCLACCTLSGVCSSAALLCQLVEVNRLAQSPDVAAILDTAHARVVCAASPSDTRKCFDFRVSSLKKLEDFKQ